MKPIMILGIALIILGVIGLIAGGISYTTHEDVVNIGDLHVTAEKHKTIPISAMAGGLMLAGGIAATVVGSKK
jgi:acyl CoA:acetate/3-ketoacid CoA transferase beta subunit